MRITKKEKLSIINNQSGKCFFCQKDMKSTLLGDPDDFNKDPDWACIDYSRMVVACRSCNHPKKGD